MESGTSMFNLFFENVEGLKVVALILQPNFQPAVQWGNNMKNQSVFLTKNSLLKNTLKKSKLIFGHKQEPNLRIEIPSLLSVQDIVRFINNKCHELGRPDLKIDESKVAKGGPFYALLKGEKKTIYGYFLMDF